MAIVTLDEMKNYLRIDFDADDNLINGFINSAQELCMEVARTKDKKVFEAHSGAKTAVMYAAAYFYEHREEADHHDLILTLRSLLYSLREETYFG